MDKSAARSQRRSRKFDVPDGCEIGARCEINTNSEFPKRGEVAYVGEIEGKKGIFIGVRLDEPYGKNDGSYKGQRYFESLPKYGVFVTPSKISIGDYPPEDIDMFLEF